MVISRNSYDGGGGCEYIPLAIKVGKETKTFGQNFYERWDFWVGSTACT
jgi:hypothetical protein